MAQFYAREARYLDPAQAVAGVRASARETNGCVYAIKATIDCAAQTNANGDVHVLGKLPVARSFIGGKLVASVTMGSAQFSIGTRSAPASYRTGASFTTPNAPADFGFASAIGAPPTEGQEDLLLTVTSGALPASGTLVVILLFIGP